jgi:superfamily I DNA/RNA helicase
LIPATSEDLPRAFEYEKNGPVSDLLEHAIAHHKLIPESEGETRILARLRDLADGCDHDIALFLDALSLERGIDHTLLEGDRVALMSLHAAKGLEWGVTFITGCEDRLLPCSLFESPDELEERRLFYVGMTRARSQLILSHVDRRAIKGPLHRMHKSPFLDRIPSQFCRPLDRGDWQAKPRAHEQLTLF